MCVCVCVWTLLFRVSPTCCVPKHWDSFQPPAILWRIKQYGKWMETVTLGNEIKPLFFSQRRVEVHDHLNGLADHFLGRGSSRQWIQTALHGSGYDPGSSRNLLLVSYTSLKSVPHQCSPCAFTAQGKSTAVTHYCCRQLFHMCVENFIIHMHWGPNV